MKGFQETCFDLTMRSEERKFGRGITMTCVKYLEKKYLEVKISENLLKKIVIFKESLKTRGILKILGKKVIEFQKLIPARWKEYPLC